MNTESLKALGLTDDQVKSVMADYGKTINPLKEQVSTLTADRDGLKKQLGTASEQLTKLQAAHKDDADLQSQIADLQAENKTAAEKHQQELNATKMEYLTELGLTKAGAKNIKMAKSVLDMDALSLDKQGNLIGLDDQLKTLQEGDDTKFLFADTSKQPDTPKILAGGNPNPEPTEPDTLASALGIKPNK